MKIIRFALITVLWIGLLAATRGAADTHYVAQGGQNPVSPYTNTWTSAASNIQDAVNVAVANDTVLVSNGVYQTGGTHIGGGLDLTNRVIIYSSITVRSVNGPDVTTIKGKFHSGEPGAADTVTNGSAAIRCVYMANNSWLIGFTLTNGATGDASETDEDRSGGGVYYSTTGNKLSNCVIVGNSAYLGAGANYGTLYNCTIVGNRSDSYGGGALGSTMYDCMVVSNSRGGVLYGDYYNCLIAYNRATYGGGAASANLYNCTVVSNYASSSGGGVRNCPIVCNSIVYFNYGCGSYNWYCNDVLSFTNSCTFPTPSGAGITWTTGITNDPQFINSVGGNYRLLNTSPCINTGTNQAWMNGAVDLDGHRRLDRFSGRPDMGCYEYVPPGTIYNFH